MSIALLNVVLRAMVRRNRINKTRKIKACGSKYIRTTVTTGAIFELQACRAKMKIKQKQFSRKLFIKVFVLYNSIATNKEVRYRH